MLVTIALRANTMAYPRSLMRLWSRQWFIAGKTNYTSSTHHSDPDRLVTIRLFLFQRICLELNQCKFLCAFDFDVGLPTFKL